MPFIGAALFLILTATTFWLFHHRRTATAPPKSRRKLPPGPRGLPIIGNLHMIGTLPHRTLTELSKQYGPIMLLRLGSVPAVVVSSPSAAELILKTHDAAFASRPKSDAADIISDGSKGLAFAPYGPHWRNIKKFVTHELLSNAKIESFSRMRKEEIDQCVRTVKAAADDGEAVDVSIEVGRLIENITYKMHFGCSGSEKPHLKSIFHEIVCTTGTFNIGDYIPFLKPFDLQGLNKKFKELGKAVDNIFTEIVKEHEEDAENGTSGKRNTDLLDIMLASCKDSSSPYKLDLVSMKALFFDLVIASYDISYSWIVWTLAEIVRNPRVMKALQEELDTKVGQHQMVEEKDLPNLEYLEMVIKETYRLHPSATLLVPHESIEDVEINGHFIPKGSRVMVNYWAIGHDPLIWSDNVEEFVPERFMNKNVDLRGHDFHLLAFGHGRRVCPGMNLGLIYVKMAVAQLVHCFHWELPNGMLPSEMDMTEKFGLASPKAKHLVAVPFYRLPVKF